MPRSYRCWYLLGPQSRVIAYWHYALLSALRCPVDEANWDFSEEASASVPSKTSTSLSTTLKVNVLLPHAEAMFPF